MRDGIVYGALIGLADFGPRPRSRRPNVCRSTAARLRSLGAGYGLFSLSGGALYTAIFGAFLGFMMQPGFAVFAFHSPIVGLVLRHLAYGFRDPLPLMATLPASPRASRLPEVPGGGEISPAGIDFLPTSLAT